MQSSMRQTISTISLFPIFSCACVYVCSQTSNIISKDLEIAAIVYFKIPHFGINAIVFIKFFFCLLQSIDYIHHLCKKNLLLFQLFRTKEFEWTTLNAFILREWNATTVRLPMNPCVTPIHNFNKLHCNEWVSLCMYYSNALLTGTRTN